MTSPSTTGAPTEDELLAWMDRLSNWGRWGTEDELGTLNLLSTEATLRAARGIEHGRTVGCAKTWRYERGSEPDAPVPPEHEMLAVYDEDRPGADPFHQFAFDSVKVAFHSREVTHLDSLAHCFWNGRMYNGKSSALVDSVRGATLQAIDIARGGIATRGILIDAPYLRGTGPIPAGTGVGLRDFDAAESRCGITPEPGDVVLVRAGLPNERAGALPEVLPLLRERDVAVLGSDTGNEVRPSGYPRFSSPIHQVGMVAMGLWILDAATLEELAQTCREYGRWEFMFTIAPLPIPLATGSPVNPVAIF